MNEEQTSGMSTTIGALAEALAKAQSQMRHASKDSKNPHFRSTYADLASVLDAAREPLTKNGLSISQLPSFDSRGVVVKTILLHTSGEYLWTSLAVPVPKDNAQGVGSAITYARRYSLSAIVGIAQDDDDGNAASASPARQPNDDGAEKKRILSAVGDECKRLRLTAEDIQQWCADYGASNPREMALSDLKSLLQSMHVVE